MGPLISELVDTELHEAVRFADVSDVREALLNNNNPNQIGLYQWAPIHEAANNGELEIVELLLKHGGNPNVADHLNGRTPLHYAAQEDQTDCLTALLAAGGNCALEDNDGKTVFDVAQHNCLKILKKHGQTCGRDDHKPDGEGPQSQTEEGGDLSAQQNTDDSVSHLEVDGHSLASSCSSLGSYRHEDTHAPALGQIELSFEYDSRKGSLRIRVWQLSDILLPPADSSMISSVYVKSFLIPDPNRGSKRKTEEVKVSSSMGHLTTPDGRHCTFTPVQFNFSKSLDYAGITKEEISNKIIQLEACVTQKYSWKSFLVSMCRMPCKSAVKKLVRQKYPLIPCNNRTIPANMKLYSSEHLQVPRLSGTFHSDPDIRCLSKASLNSDSSGYPASDSILECVSVQRAANSVVPNVVITLAGEEGEDAVLSEVRSIDSGTADVQESRETSVCLDSLEDSSPINEILRDSSGKSNAKCIQFGEPTTVISETPGLEGHFCHATSKSQKQSGFYPVAAKSKQFLKHSKCVDNKKIHLTKVKKFVQDNFCETSLCSENNSSPVHSRPNTLTWDNYDLETDHVRISMQSVDMPLCDLSTAGSLLPLPTTLDIPCEESSFSKPPAGVPLQKQSTSTVVQSSASLDDNDRLTKSVADLNVHVGRGKSRRLLGKKGNHRGKIPPTEPSCQSPPTAGSGSREITAEVNPSCNVTMDLLTCKGKKITTNLPENTVVDIDSDELVSVLPEKAHHFSIPMQVFISEDSD